MFASTGYNGGQAISFCNSNKREFSFHPLQVGITLNCSIAWAQQLPMPAHDVSCLQLQPLNVGVFVPGLKKAWLVKPEWPAERQRSEDAKKKMKKDVGEVPWNSSLRWNGNACRALANDNHEAPHGDQWCRAFYLSDRFASPQWPTGRTLVSRSKGFGNGDKMKEMPVTSPYFPCPWRRSFSPQV